MSYKQDEIKDILMDMVLDVLQKYPKFTAWDLKYIMENTPNKIIDAISDKEDERTPF